MLQGIPFLLSFVLMNLLYSETVGSRGGPRGRNTLARLQFSIASSPKGMEETSKKGGNPHGDQD